MYHCTEMMTPKYEIKYTGKIIVKVWGRKREFNIADEQLRKIRHEMVSSALGPETDEKLSAIGVKGELSILSPDYILRDQSTIIEVGTSAGTDQTSLQTDYKGKVIKYNDLVNKHGYQLATLIVGRSSVYTNLYLTQAAVNSLILRFRIGLALEVAVTDLVGENIFSEEWSELENKCKAVLQSITATPESSDTFDVNTILTCSKPPTRSDNVHVGNLLKDSLRRSTEKSPESEETLKQYIQSFDEDSKTTMKRITNVPMIISKMDSNPQSYPMIDAEMSNMPLWLKSIWVQGREVEVEVEDLERSVNEGLQRVAFDKHRVQKGAAFNVNLSDSEKIEAAKSGIWAKSMRDNPEIIKKDIESHKSYHPTETETKDIEEFMNKDLLCTTDNTSAIPKEIWTLIKKAKSITGKNSLSELTLNTITKSKYCKFAQTISELFTEICYSYKYWIKRSDFYHKIHKGVHMLIRCTGDHVFCSFAFPKKTSEIIDTGRIGPLIYESDDYYYTKFASYNEPTIEHFVKAGPYLTSIYCHLMSHFELPLQDATSYDNEFVRTLNGITLLYLNNKTDAEELITNQRYLTMSVLEEIDPNPFRFVDRLPEVYRSRLTCYILKQTIKHMNMYNATKVTKSKVGVEEDEFIEHSGIYSIFTNKSISLKQKINEFYFGYVISKERGRGSDRNFKIMKKIVKEEYRFRDTVTKTFEESMNPKIHVSNPIAIKVFCSIFRKIMYNKYGKDWVLMMTKQIYSNWARKSFYEISTMKVASRTYMERIVIPEIKLNSTTADIRKSLEHANENETKRRPRVMEAIKLLIDDYVKEGNAQPSHPIDLLKYCMDKLSKKGYFDSDIFPKPQHGGDREIHVLEITMRIVQLFIESLGRSICEMIDSDSLTHPKSKDYFVSNHYRQANENLKSFVTLGKSADATKWCQRHHSSKFAAILVGAVSNEFHPFILLVMHMWQFKRISFPIQFAANFLSNPKTKSNPVYERMRNEFYQGNGIFKEAYNSKMWIQSGMMQGILHYVSSATHGIIQEVMKLIQQTYLKTKGINSVITIIQGSDDSAELLSLSGSKPSLLVRLGTTMLHWKEHMSKYFCVYTSRSKSSIGTLDMIEYNSEWFVRTSTIKPTFRWVSSCLETGIVEKFVDRYNNMQGSLTTVLEGGGKLMEAAMIQICQAWMHYMLLGLHTSILAETAAYYLTHLLDPSLGFFLMDSDFTAGIVGYTYNLHQLYTKTHYGAGLGRSIIKDVEIDFFEDDNKDPSISKDLRKVRIKFGDHKIFSRILRDMSVPELEEVIKEVEKDPSLLYFPSHEWETSKFRIFLKMFEPGVKESLSRHSATARMMSASAYMLTRPCLTHPRLEGKCSLFKLLVAEFYDKKHSKLDSSLVFLHNDEYNQLAKFVDSLTERATVRQQMIKTRSKQKIIVFEAESQDVNLIDMCRRMWFGKGKVPLSSRQFTIKWKELKTRYKFLDDSREVTKSNLHMNDVQMKNFLETQSEKVRTITLMDTTARTSAVESSITRIFWSNTKLLLSRSEEDDEESSFTLRSRIFSVLTSFMPYTQIKKEVSFLLGNANILKNSSVPYRISKLKCIRDLLVTGNKYSIVQRILDQKLGVIGFFTVRQAGWGKERSGYGEWKGRILDSSVKIEMMGNKCTMVTLSNLSRAKELSPMLMKLINGFSLSASGEYTESEHWLTDSGKIVFGKGKKTSIPINLDPDMSVTIIDEIVNYDWHWDVSYNNIKIVAHVDRNTKIVILSEAFLSSDWDPYHGLIDNSELGKWSRGERLSMDTLRNEFSEFFGKDRKQMLKCLNNQSTTSTSNGWNMRRLVDLLKYFYPKLDIKQQTDDSQDQSVSSDESEMRALMEMVNLEETEIDIDANEEAELTADDLFEMNEIDEADLEAQLEILLQNSDPSMVQRLDRSKMPISNQFFFNINVLSKAQTGMGFSELWTRFSDNEALLTHDFLGVILSFMTSRICFKLGNADEDEAYTREQESISLITSIKSEMEVDDLNEEELDWKIENLKESLKTAPPRLQPKIKISIKRHETAKKLIRIDTHTETDLDSIPSKEILLKLQPYIKNKVLAKNEKLMLAQIRMILDKSMDDLLEKAEITEHQHAIYRESISKSYTTPMMIDTISLSFQLTFKVLDYISGDDDNVIVLVEQ